MWVLAYADLEQQEAGHVTDVGRFFALEKDHVQITTEFWLLSVQTLSGIFYD